MNYLLSYIQIKSRFSLVASLIVAIGNPNFHFLYACSFWLYNLKHVLLKKKTKNAWLSLTNARKYSIFCSCFANVVFQCLMFTPPLTTYFLQQFHSRACASLVLWFFFFRDICCLFWKAMFCYGCYIKLLIGRLTIRFKQRTVLHLWA